MASGEETSRRYERLKAEVPFCCGDVTRILQQSPHLQHCTVVSTFEISKQVMNTVDNILKLSLKTQLNSATICKNKNVGKCPRTHFFTPFYYPGVLSQKLLANIGVK